MKKTNKTNIAPSLRITLTPQLEHIIKSVWIHEGKLYVICTSKHIVQLTRHFSKKYKLPKEKVHVGTIEDLIKEIINHNTRVLISIRDGRVVHDPIHLLHSLKINIQKGLLVGTKEAILKKFMLIKDYIKEIEATKERVFDNIYVSTIEAAQTALIIKGNSNIALIPRLIPDVLRETLLGRGLEKTQIEYASEIILKYKAYEHKKCPLPEGKRLDELARKAELFRDAVKKLR
jgi:hypothetical protein